MKRICFVLPLNELSGSCVSADKLRNLLESNGYSVDVFCPDGDFLVPSSFIPTIGFNLLSTIKAYRVIKRELGNYDLCLFFTIRTVPLAMMFGTHSLVYLHEVDVKPRWLFSCVSEVIKHFFKRKLVVNPQMSSKFNATHLLPNFMDVKYSEHTDIKEYDYILVANCTPKKGIFDFVVIAERFPQKKFVFLTVDTPHNGATFLAICNSAPSNLIIITDQTRKGSLISQSRYLLNLSHLDETFGLTLLEAVCLGTIPLSYRNMGSLYFFNSEDFFIERNNVADSLHTVVNNLDANYALHLTALQKRVNEHFSSTRCLSTIESIIFSNEA